MLSVRCILRRHTLSVIHNLHVRSNSTATATVPARQVVRPADQGPHPNEPIIEMLRRELREEERELKPNVFKVKAFANAIEAITQIEETIKSGDDYALEVKGIGIGIKNRINQYFIQLDLTAASNHEQEQEALKRRAALDLQKIPGIGRVKAKALAEAGCWSLSDLVSSDRYHHMLTPQQIICLKYVDELDRSMTRTEAESIAEACRRWLPPPYEVVLAGEYRRGRSDISALVVMLLHPDHVHVPMPADPQPFLDAATSARTSTPSSSSTSPASTPATPSPTTILTSSSQTTPPTITSDPTTTTSLPTTPSPTPTKRRRNLLKKPDRSQSLTKATRKTSLLHNDVIPTLRRGDIMCETISETLNSWTGVVQVPSPTSTETGSGEIVPRDAEAEERSLQVDQEEGKARSGVALSLQTPVGSRYRKVAFHLIPQKSKATALLALTGDDELNRHMRRKAESMGMLLNEYGLWRWNPRRRGSLVEPDTSSDSDATTLTSVEERSLQEALVDAPATPPPEMDLDSAMMDDGHWGMVQTPTEAGVFRELRLGFVKPEKRSWAVLSGSAMMRPSRKKFSTSFLGS